MNLKYCLTGILCLFLKTDAQIKPLAIGDKVPDVTIKNIYNYSALQSTLSAFNNKLLIIDFMATTCSSCIKALPSFDALQKKYGDKIQIILVTNQSAEKVRTFLKAHSFSFPFVTQDTLLGLYFPHKYLSHEVWINDGIVKAITHAEYVTAINIEKLLNNKIVSWPVKRDEAAFDFTRPLLHINEETVPELSYPSSVYYSVFNTNMNSIPSRYTETTDSNARTVKISMVNMQVIDMYLRSYGRFRIPESHIILEVKDTDRLVYNKAKGFKEDWREHSTYCYEAVLPLSLSKPQRQQKIRSDLDMYLGVRGRIEKRNVPCLVFTAKDSVSELKLTYSTKPVANLTSLQNVIYDLDHTFSGIPVIDETGFKQHAYLNIDESMITNKVLLKKVLNKYGLQVKTEERMIETLVLSKNK